MRTLMMAAVLALTGLGVGCAVRAQAEPVVIEDSHRHDDFCGHYHRDGRWYYEANHVHGPSCGHMYRKGMWVTRL